MWRWRPITQRGCNMALDFLAGAPFKILYNGVILASRNTKLFKSQLRNLELTLQTLETCISTQLSQHNSQLSLPIKFMEELQRKMNEGVELVHKLSSLSDCNVRIWGSRSRYADQLEELNQKLEVLWEIIMMQDIAQLGRLSTSIKFVREILDILEIDEMSQCLSDVHSEQKVLNDRVHDLEKLVLGNQQEFNDGHCNLEAKERVESVASGSEVSVTTSFCQQGQQGKELEVTRGSLGNVYPTSPTSANHTT